MKSLGTPGSYEVSMYQKAWERSGLPNAAEVIEAVLDEMEEFYEGTQDPRCRPSAYNFNIAMSAWAKRGELDRVEYLFDRLNELYKSTGNKRLQFTNDNYKALLVALASSGKPDSGQKAIGLIARAESAREMDASAPVPRRNLYQFAFAAIGRSSAPDKMKKCLKLFDRMKIASETNRLVVPDAFTYTVVMRTIASVSGSQDENQQAFRCIVSIFHESIELFPTYTKLYTRLITSAQQLLKDESTRNNMLFEALAGCSTSVLQHGEVRTALEQALSASLQRKLLRCDSRTIESLFAD